MSWFAVGAAILTAVSAYSASEQQKDQLESQQDIAEYNSKVSNIQAEQATKIAGIKEEDQRRQARRIIGSQIAASSESGGGLNIDLLRQSVFDSETDALNIRYEGELNAAGQKSQANLDKFQAANFGNQASAQGKASYLNAAASLTNSYTSYNRYGALRAKGNL